MLRERRARSSSMAVGSSSSWSSINDARADAYTVAILPHGVEGHLVREVVANMRLQHTVLLTANLHVRALHPLTISISAHCPAPDM